MPTNGLEVNPLQCEKENIVESLLRVVVVIFTTVKLWNFYAERLQISDIFISRSCLTIHKQASQSHAIQRSRMTIFT